VTNDLGNLLQNLRKGESLRSVASRSGLSHNYIRQLEVGIDSRSNHLPKPSADILKRLSIAYAFPYSELLEIAGILDDSYQQLKDIEPITDVTKIPLLREITAKAPLYDNNNVLEWVFVSTKDVLDGEYFKLIVKGSSMQEIHIIDGSKVLVRRQPHVDDGEVAVIIHEEEGMIRRIRYQGGQIILQAANSNYAPLLCKKEDVTIIGKVIRVEMSF